MAVVEERSDPQGRHLAAPTDEQVLVGELRDVFRRYHARCFWSWSPDTEVGLNDLPEIIRGLRMHGGREGFLLAGKLCR